jgi:hypothetical protein
MRKQASQVRDLTAKQMFKEGVPDKMAWFRYYYRCEKCHAEWEEEWSSMCEDDCPSCEERHMTPYESDDLTQIIEERGGQFIVYRSPASAEHYPNYECIAKFPTLKHAETYVRLHAMPR